MGAYRSVEKMDGVADFSPSTRWRENMRLGAAEEREAIKEEVRKKFFERGVG